MDKLKPCPFCGGKARLDIIERYDGANTFFVRCTTGRYKKWEILYGIALCTAADKRWKRIDKEM